MFLAANILLTLNWKAAGLDFCASQGIIQHTYIMVLQLLQF